MWEIAKNYGELLSALVALGSGVTLVFRRVRPHLKALARLYEFTEGPAFAALDTLAKSGVLEQIPAAISQLRPNGGESLVDKVTRIELSLYSYMDKARHLFNANNMAFWEMDVTGECIYASEALATMVGLPQAAVLGNGWQTMVHPADQERIADGWETAVRQKRAFIERFKLVHLDKETIGVQTHLQPIFNSKKEITGFIGTLSHIAPEEF